MKGLDYYFDVLLHEYLLNEEQPEQLFTEDDVEYDSFIDWRCVEKPALIQTEGL